MVYLILGLVIVLALLIIIPWREATEYKIKNLDSNNEVLPQHIRYVAWNGKYSLDVVGESHYQNSLCVIAGPKEEQAKDVDCHAVLIREPDNAYDHNAVQVIIKGKKVGYLSKNNAASLVREMNRAFLSNEIMFVAKAKINGGWCDDTSEGNYGVVIDFPPMSKLESVMSFLSMEDSEQKVASMHDRS